MTITIAITFSLLMYFVKSISLAIAIFISYVGLSIFLAYRLKVNNYAYPPVVVLSVLSLYGGVFPIYFLLGGERLLGVSEVSVLLGLKCFYIFAVSFVVSGSLYTRFMKTDRDESYKIIPTFSIWIAFFAFLTLFLPALFQDAVASGKADRMTQGVSIYQSFFGGSLLPFSIIQAYSLNRHKRLEVWSLVLILVIGSFGIFILNERDLVAYPLIIVFLLSAFTFRPSIIWLGLSSVSVILLLFALGVHRSYAESGSLRELGNLMMVLQENEFISSGRNLAVVIDQNVQGVYTILGDFLNPIFVSYFPSGSVWFSQNFYANKGFGVIAEGIVNFGFFGPALFGCGMALLLHYLYFKASFSILYKAVYPIVLIACLYSLRGDLSAITAGVLRKILIPLFCMFVLSKILPKKSRVKK